MYHESIPVNDWLATHDSYCGYTVAYYHEYNDYSNYDMHVASTSIPVDGES